MTDGVPRERRKAVKRMEACETWPASIAWMFLRALAMLFVLVVGFLLIDNHAFELPLTEPCEAGLAANSAPQPPFATTIVFSANPGYPIETLLAAKDQSLGNVRVELLGPDGRTCLDCTTDLLRGPSWAGGAQWVSRAGGAPLVGTYTLRITQNEPGRIAVYFFQGPFTARMLVLPAIALVLSLLIHLWRRREALESGATPAAVPT